MENNYIKKDKDYKVKIRNNKEISIRSIQKEILIIMDEIDRICRKHNITYGLIAGSALGIVNYGGFIPWDDDIDIFILRRDWTKFLRALEQELAEDFYYHCYEKDKRYNVLIPQMKIRKKNTYVEEENILLDNRCDGDGIFVDVVSYGEISENKLIDELFRTIIKLLTIPTVFIDNLGFNPKILKKLIMYIDKKYTRISENSNLLSQPITIPWEKFLHEPVFHKNDVLPVKEYNFEGRMYYSYNNIEKILKKWYGNNCLKKWNEKEKAYEETLPIERRVPKHIKDINLKSASPNSYKEKKEFDMWIKINFYIILLLIIFLLFNLKIPSLFTFLILIISLCKSVTSQRINKEDDYEHKNNKNISE